MYEVIVLGATFAAAGIALRCKKNCLVLEQRMQAGYEFFSALDFGTGYEKELKSREAKQLRRQLLQEPYGGDRHIYACFREADVQFGAQLVSVEKKDSSFLCRVLGVDGFATFEAKKLIDTRTNGEMCLAKTYNFLLESREEPTFSGVQWRKAAWEDHYVVCCPVPVDADYVRAREILWAVMTRFSESQRLVLSADAFDYRLKEGYPKTQDGILYLPSKAYENPALALDAGICAGEVEL